PAAAEQWLFWAGSGPTGPVVPSSQRIVPQAPDGIPANEIVLFDFEDRDVPVLCAWTLQRMEAYREAGYVDVGSCETSGLIDKYIYSKRAEYAERTNPGDPQET